MILDVCFELVASKSPGEFSALLKREIELIGRIVKATGIPPINPF